MSERFRRSFDVVIGISIGFLISGFVTSTLGFCGQDFLTCLSVHTSAAPLTQFAGEMMIAVGLLLLGVSSLWVHQRGKNVTD
jgi:hypothetical protein